MAGDPHAASAGLVADVDGAWSDLVGLGDAPHDPFQGGVGGGDRSVVADLTSLRSVHAVWLRGFPCRDRGGAFAVGSGIGDGDGGLFFMDVESDVDCGRRVCVRFHSLYSIDVG